MRKIVRTVFIIILGLVVLVCAIAVYVKTALPNVGSAPDIKVSITPERVARGEYLANHVSACMDCHSKRNANLYGGPAREGSFGGGGERFGKEEGLPGTLYSKNITPYALHNWTDGEIFRAITCGQSKNGEALFPLMGYAAYGKMDREDVYSIIAYIRTLPAIKNEVPERQLDFPVNFLVNTMPSKASLSAKPDTNNTVAYGGYLVTIAQCAECHSKVDKGSVVAGTEFGGGREFAYSNGTSCNSANITFDKETGIGNWSKESFIQRFQQNLDAANKAKPVGKNDFNTVMPWIVYAGMTPKDLSSIYAYLQTVTPIKNNVQRFTRRS